MSIKDNLCSYKMFLTACQWDREDWTGPELLFSQNRLTPVNTGSDSRLRCQDRKHVLDQFSINQHSRVKFFYIYSLCPSVSQPKTCVTLLTIFFSFFAGNTICQSWELYLRRGDSFSLGFRICSVIAWRNEIVSLNLEDDIYVFFSYPSVTVIFCS